MSDPIRSEALCQAAVAVVDGSGRAGPGRDGHGVDTQVLRPGESRIMRSKAAVMLVERDVLTSGVCAEQAEQSPWSTNIGCC